MSIFANLPSIHLVSSLHSFPSQDPQRKGNVCTSIKMGQNVPHLHLYDMHFPSPNFQCACRFIPAAKLRPCGFWANLPTPQIHISSFAVFFS
jgi:hypothetical protein